MRMEYGPEHIHRGFELEEHLIGHKIDWPSILKQNKISPETLRYRDWQKIIQELYPENPTMPKQKWGKDLYNFVAEKLGLDIENTEDLKFFNSLGTPMDRNGIDCFFTFKNPQTGKEAMFTIDVTANPKKDEWKANLVIGEMPNYRESPEEKEKYIEEMEKASGRIAEKLRDDTEFIH